MKTYPSSLEADMVGAARDLLGSGFTHACYRSAASEFIQIAERYVDQVRNELWATRQPARPSLNDDITARLKAANQSLREMGGLDLHQTTP